MFSFHKFPQIKLLNSFIVVLLISCCHTAIAWEHHPLLTAPVMEVFAENTPLTPATVIELQEFLSAVEGPLAVFLAEEEDWAQENLAWYVPCPEELDFVATGNPDDIVQRFFHAIRINPNTKTPLYYATLSGSAIDDVTLLSPQEVSLFPETVALTSFDFVPVPSGSVINAVDIIATASNEPDFGMDTGLFENNNSDFGQIYGFGSQAFGNPGLDFGSQAPFHMGFYHESSIVFFFAGFLKECYPEYRIHLFKRLSEFAFEQGYDYWGWRFMGWGLHYLADLSMPYHTTVLPGYSTFRMLWINFLDIIGISGPADDALQLVSNRHIALETYQKIVMERTLRNNKTNVIFDVLNNSYDTQAYTDDLPRSLLARDSNALARKINKVLTNYMPKDFVLNPDIELAEREDLESIVEIIKEEHGEEVLAELDQCLADSLKTFATYAGSYVQGILDNTQ